MNQYHEDNEDGSNEIEIGISFHLIPFGLYGSMVGVYKMIISGVMIIL